MKAYLLDTNVISEIMTSVPNQRVIDFLAHLNRELFIGYYAA
jgi:predicted nucleic acid-binding protein